MGLGTREGVWSKTVRGLLLGGLILGIFACAGPRIRGDYPPGTVERGVASWYGQDFHGRPTASGEIYDMYDHTAAHRTIPLGTVVRVTNLENGLRTQVRINDRGPFVGGRVIDLSYAGARDLEMVGPGTAPVAIEVLEAAVGPAGAFTVQVGAFAEQENALRLEERLRRDYRDVIVVPYESPGGILYRVRVGETENEARIQKIARRLGRDGYTTLIMRKD